MSGLLTAVPQLAAYDATRSVLHTPSGHYVLLNAGSVHLLGVLAEAPDLPAAAAAFSAHHGCAFTGEQVAELAQRHFAGYQLLSADSGPVRPPTASYIKPRLELLPPRVSRWLAAPLTWCYTPWLFWPLLLALTVGLGWELTQVPAPRPTLLASSRLLLVMFYFSALVHELGHVAACRRAGLRPGGVGMGLYLLLPVFYADLSAIWLAGKQQRIIANLAGIYSQLLLAAATLVAGRLLDSPAAVLAAHAVALAALWQLNPFVRHDGYWLLADLTNTPNLLARAVEARQLAGRRVWAWLRRRRLPPLLTPPPAAWLTGYGLLNTLVVIGVFVALFYVNWRAMLEFPAQVFSLLAHLGFGSLTRQDLPTVPLPVLAFYGWLIRWLVLRVRRRTSPHPGPAAS